jgi:hypothetical protein
MPRAPISTGEKAPGFADSGSSISGKVTLLNFWATWTQRLDPNHQMMRQYGANALPTYVLIGKDGAVVNQYVGDDPDVPIIERIGPDLKKSLDGKS